MSKKVEYVQMKKEEADKLKRDYASLTEDVRDSKNYAAEIVKRISLHLIDTFPKVPVDYKPPKCEYKNCTNAMNHIKSRVEAYMTKCDQQNYRQNCEHCGVNTTVANLMKQRITDLENQMMAKANQSQSPIREVVEMRSVLSVNEMIVADQLKQLNDYRNEIDNLRQESIKYSQAKLNGESKDKLELELKKKDKLIIEQRNKLELELRKKDKLITEQRKNIARMQKARDQAEKQKALAVKLKNVSAGEDKIASSQLMHSNELQFKLNQKEKLILELEKVVLNYRKKTQILQFADENTRLKKENATLLEDKRNSKNLTAEVVQMISLHMVDTFPYVPADYKPPKGDYKNCYNAIRHIQSHIEAYMAKCDGRKSNRAEGLKKKYQQFTKLKENFDKAWTMIENSQATDVNLSDDTPRDKSSESGIIEVQQSGDSSTSIDLFNCSSCQKSYSLNNRLLFNPCGHGCCPTCSSQYQACHICQTPIQSKQKQFE